MLAQLTCPPCNLLLHFLVSLRFPLQTASHDHFLQPQLCDLELLYGRDVQLLVRRIAKPAASSGQQWSAGCTAGDLADEQPLSSFWRFQQAEVRGDKDRSPAFHSRQHFCG